MNSYTNRGGILNYKKAKKFDLTFHILKNRSIIYDYTKIILKKALKSMTLILFIPVKFHFL